MRREFWILALLVTAIVVTGVSLYGVTTQAQQQAAETPTPPGGMSGMMEATPEFSLDELAPLVRGLYEGGDVLFLHTEASDAKVARILTDMMGPQVLVVPGLAEIPTALLGNVYVFTNGVPGGGPMGFQPDVFDSIPGDETYTPLRMLNLVTWNTGSTPRQLRSIAEIEAAKAAGAIVIDKPGVVINMPILVWPGGHR